MKPNFVLGLGHDGISLLHRGVDGWHTVGEVALDDAEFTAKLGYLHQTAAALESGGVTTKLVIPNSQILFTTVNAPGPSESERHAQIRTALDGVTPYDVDDLVYDWSEVKGIVHIAAVARETLTEAEAFAVEHNFNPLSFVAIPDDSDFSSTEPFFGVTKSAKTLLEGAEIVERDKEVIRVPSPPPTPKSEAKSEAAPEVGPKPETGTKPVVEDEPVVEVEADAKPEIEVEVKAKPEPEPAPEPEADVKAEPAVEQEVDAKPESEDKPEAEAKPEPETASEPKADTKPEPEVEAKAKPEVEVKPEAAANVEAEPDVEVKPKPKSKTRPKAKTKAKAKRSQPIPPKGKPVVDPEDSKEEAQAPGGILSSELPGLDTYITGTPIATFSSRRGTAAAVDNGQAPDRTEKPETGSANSAKAKDALVPTLGGVQRKEKKKPKKPLPNRVTIPIKPDQPPEAATQPAASTDAAQTSTKVLILREDEERAMTVFGARKKPSQRGKPRHLGLSMMLMLFAAFSAVALWSSFYLSDETAFWRGGQNDGAVMEATVETPDASSQVSNALAMLSEPTIQHISPPDPLVLVLPDPLAVAEPEPEVAEPDALAVTEPDTQVTDAPDTQVAAVEPDALGADDPDMQVAAEPDTLADPDTLAAADPEVIAPVVAIEPAPAQTPPPAPLPAQSIPEVAQAAYQETGIWQLAPAPPKLPEADEIETLYVTSVDPAILSQDAVALPQVARNSNDAPPETQTSPAAHNTEFILDERGLVIPSADGTANPDGVLVFAGAPPTKPRARGNRVPQVTVEPNTRLASFRPSTRPANLTQQSETAQEAARLGGYTRAQLAALRPPQRAPQQPEKPEIPKAEQERDETPTAQAVVLSSAPEHRPRNFAKLVARARATAPTAPREAATTAVAVPRNQTVAPSAPTRASVARLATTKNAINLRRTSLIGVYGSPSKRRALVRLSNGRYVKVQVGQRVDGGKVAAIGEAELRYVKGGRTIVLKMPKS